MRYFLKADFFENGPTRPIQGLALAIVREDGESRYWVFSDAHLQETNKWVKENILTRFAGHPTTDRQNIAMALVEFLSGDPAIEFWSYYGDYDRIITQQVFGSMMDIPRWLQTWCMSVKQYSVMLGKPDVLPEMAGYERNAYGDAKWARDCWISLNKHLTEREQEAALQTDGVSANK